MKLEVTLSEESLERLSEKILSKQAKKEEPKPEHVELKEDYYTVNDVAKIIKKNKQTVTSHIRQGFLKANKPGKSYLITKQQLTDYVNGNY